MKPDEGQTYWAADQDDQQLLANDYDQADDQYNAMPEEPIAWQASEYVQHEKQTIWYVALAGITIALLALAIFMKVWTFAILVVVMGVGVGVLASRPPHTARYTLSENGLRIDDKSFGFHDFRAFGVVQEGAFSYIVLIPNKRFMPTVNVYFPNELGEQIVDTFGLMLPMERVEPDIVDRLARKLHF